MSPALCATSTLWLGLGGDYGQKFVCRIHSVSLTGRSAEPFLLPADSQFPIDISAVKKDHDFLEKDLVEPLCR